VYPKIFINCTIFVKSVSHFSGRVTIIPKLQPDFLPNQRTTQWEDPTLGIAEDVFNDPVEVSSWNPSFTNERTTASSYQYPDHRPNWSQQCSMPTQQEIWVRITFTSKSYL